MEGFLSESQAHIEKCENVNMDLEGLIKRKENEVNSLCSELDEERSQVAAVQKKVKQFQYRLSEAEEMIADEKQQRGKAEKQKEELTRNLADMLLELEDAGRAEQHANELRKKAEAELNRMRRDVEENNKRHEQAFAQYRKKHDDAVNEMNNQVEHLLKVKTKLEKERLTLIANNDQSRVPTGFLDKNELFEIEVQKQAALRQRFRKD